VPTVGPLPVYLDTRVLVCLYQDGVSRLTPTGSHAIDAAERLIVAQAAHGKAPLLTADRNILVHYSRAFW
jgi:PIN domain nuclease of toxin-antitoxin system